MPKTVTDETFEKEIQVTDKMVLVDFYATWCEPCSMLAPILEKVEKDLAEKIVVLKANVDETPQSSQKFQVNRIPMVVLFRNGEPIDSFTGLRTEAELKQWLDQIITNN